MKFNVRKLVLTAILTGVAIVGSTFNFPIFGSRCAPVQHMVNVLCAIFVGPIYAIAAAFSASLLRNLMGIGSLLAFPGSMIGALLSSLVYMKTKKISFTLIGELIGTGILGGLCAYPIAILFMGKAAAGLAFYVYVVPFLISTLGGVFIAGLLLGSLEKAGAISKMQSNLNK